MAFDASGRRLITGGHNGTVKVWNSNTGVCLRELKTEPGCSEISCVAHIISVRSVVVISLMCCVGI